LLTECRGPRTECAGFDGTTWPVTSQSNIMRMPGEMLLDRWRRHFPEELLDIGGYMHRLNAGEFANSLSFTPAQKIRRSSRVRCPRVAVADVNGEEFEEA
jgi:hypothetical protein